MFKTLRSDLDLDISELSRLIIKEKLSIRIDSHVFFIIIILAIVIIAIIVIAILVTRSFVGLMLHNEHFTSICI